MIWTSRRHPLIPERRICSLAPTMLRAASGGKRTYQSVILADSPAAYWRLGEAAGATTAVDLVAGANGTYQGTPTLAQPGLITGDPDTSVAFGGPTEATDYITTTYTGPAGSAARTFECWVDGVVLDTGIGSGNCLMGYGANTTSNKFLIRIEDGANGSAGAVRLEITGDYIIGSLSIADGLRHHIVLAFDGPTLQDRRLYIDGVADTTVSGVGTGTTTVATTAAALTLAADDLSTSPTVYRYFQGTLDEVAFYNSALTAAQATAHYNAGK